MIVLMPVKRREIKQRRKELGLTLIAAARLAGWNNAQDWKRIEDIESDLRISTLQRVANVLGCTVNDLITKQP